MFPSAGIIRFKFYGCNLRRLDATPYGSDLLSVVSRLAYVKQVTREWTVAVWVRFCRLTRFHVFDYVKKHICRLGRADIIFHRSILSCPPQGNTSQMLIEPSITFENIASALPQPTEGLDRQIESILRFNARMERMASVALLNEKAIESLLDDLDGTGFPQDGLYWLTLARVNELTLFCAGNYADSCGFSLVGDLLLNPRLILAHVRGMDRPVVKERHTPLTEQFREMAEDRFGVIEWLKTNTVLETKTEALLPELSRRLQRSAVVHETYLKSVETRKVSIAELSGLLCSRFEDGPAFYAWLVKADQADREYMETRLCRFDLEVFLKLGEDIKRLARDPRYQSSFLKNSVFDCPVGVRATP